MQIRIINSSKIAESEEHDVDFARKLAKKILDAGCWTVPILVLDKPRVVLDGHHRLAACKLLKLQRLPAIIIQKNDSRLSLETWRTDESISMIDVLSAARTGKLLPPKSTKFTIDFQIPSLSVSLSNLMT